MDQQNKHYFYVVRCKDDTLYAGYTNHLQKRIDTHNAGKGAKYTKARLPVECIYHEVFDSKTEAMRAEYAFKQLTRKQKLDYIRSNSNEITKE